LGVGYSVFGRTSDPTDPTDPIDPSAERRNIAMIERNDRRPFSVLQRFAQRAARATEAAQERCDFCGELLAGEHRHLLEIAPREVRCVCRACSILFDKEAASQGRYRLIPDRRLSLEAFRMSDWQWQSLGIPVGLAFFFHSTPTGQVMALYPGPMGATEALLRPGAWEELAERNPVLAGMRPDVEALLVHRARGARQQFLVPIDECYRLVGLIRVQWKGLSGVQEVWKEIAQFFEALEARSEIIRMPATGEDR
jgi:hypothetical protein